MMYKIITLLLLCEMFNFLYIHYKTHIVFIGQIYWVILYKFVLTNMQNLWVFKLWL